MAPAVWNDDEFVSGGLKGITKFQGQLTEIEEDVEGKYGDQLALYFDECTVLESAEEVSLEGGKYTDWIKQTNKKNSVNQAFVGAIATFIKAHNLKGGVPDALYGQDIIWERQVVIEGNEEDGMSPGLCLLPIAMADDEPPPATKSRRGRTVDTKGATVDDEEAPPKRARRSRAAAAEPPAEEESADVPKELIDFILSRVGEDGATQDLIRRDIAKKVTMKKLKDAVDGGLEAVLVHMVSEEVLTEDDGTYFLAED